MRKWIALLFLLGTAWPAMAAKTLSIDQMEQLLVTLHDKPDGKVAAELDDVRLTERVSSARLTRWQAEFSGPKAHLELMKLADLSAFLDPPASDLLPNPRPSVETQMHILRMAVQTVATTMSRLPDFFATRETTHFEAAPVPFAANTADSTVGLRWTENYSQTVTYRHGQEVSFFKAKEKHQKQPAGLTTEGEFGPILLQVFHDALTSRIAFARWVQGASGPTAVFAYSVPEDASHFRVDTMVDGKAQILHPPYHGEIEIDSTTGAILRLSEIAEMAPPRQAEQAAIEIEYAPVAIGGRSYILPAKGVAFSKSQVPIEASPQMVAMGILKVNRSFWPIQTGLNDVAFNQYHEFRSEVRIVAKPSEGSGNAADGNGTTPPEIAGIAAPAPSSAPANVPAVSAAPASETTEESSSNASPLPKAEAQPAPASNPSTARSAEATPALPPSNSAVKPETESAEKAAQPPAASTAANSPVAPPVFDAQSKIEPILKVNSHLVVVDVVVRKGDRPVADLAQGDFTVSEDGVPQTIRYFTPHFADRTAAPASGATPQPPSLPPDTWTNLPVANVTDSVTVLLLDSLNTQPTDMVYLRREMIRYLKTQSPDQRIAVFALGQRLLMLQGFTTDTGQLLASLEKADATSPTSLLAPEEQKVDEAQELADMKEEGLPRQIIMNVNNGMAESDAAQTTMRVDMTLEAMQQLSRYLTGIDGRKNLVWFSGSFPIQLMLKMVDLIGSHIGPAADFNAQLKETADMLAAARVAVYPVDVRGVMIQPMFSSAQRSSPTTTSAGDFATTPVANNTTSATNVNGGPQGGTFGSDALLSPKQRAAEHNTMDVLAQQTGGRAVYESNGLEQAMADALNDGSSYYTLAYVPTNSNYNGAPRNIRIRLTHGKGELFYRRSYYAVAGLPSEKAAAQDSRNVFLASMQRGVPASSEIVFNVRAAAQNQTPPSGPIAGKNPAMKNRAARYAIDYAANLSTLDLAQDTNGVHRGRLAAVAIAYDRDGNRLNWVESDLPITLDRAAWDRAGRSGLEIHQVLDLPAGDVFLRVGLYDEDSGRVGSMEIPLNVALPK